MTLVSAGLASSHARAIRATLTPFLAGTSRNTLYSLIETAKLNGIDPEACLRDVLARIAGHPATRLAELLPWTWATALHTAQAA